ncbi:MAG: lipoate--protein ligase family protein [Candidatus Brockarchaeota archaeon]|nr:lipoate--protein ligase family protein [Candidatus Brockarchaeota archaeon]
MNARPAWRLLLTGLGDPYVNMAIDESLLLHRSRGENQPTVRFYGWSTPTISIGYFQAIEEEVDLEKAAALGVAYVRRISGGGAVFHDNEVTYSLVVSEDDPAMPRDIQESIRLICMGVIEGLKGLGIEAKFKPVNDVLVDGKKVSGSAQTRKHHTILQHGTVLLDVNYEEILSLLKRSARKMKRRTVEELKEHVAGINGILGADVSQGRLVGELAKGFGVALNVNLVEGTLTESEQKLAAHLAASKYSTREWNHRH